MLYSDLRHFFRIRGGSSGISRAWSTECVNVSFNWQVHSGERRTCLVYNINKGLCIVPDEATDRVTRVVVRKNRLEQGGKLTGGKRASDQTSTGWALKLRKRKG
jgi:hypothetical protein